MSVSQYEYLTELTGPDWHPNQLRRVLEDVEQGNFVDEKDFHAEMKRLMGGGRKRATAKSRSRK